MLVYIMRRPDLEVLGAMRCLQSFTKVLRPMLHYLLSEADLEGGEGCRGHDHSIFIYIILGF